MIAMVGLGALEGALLFSVLWLLVPRRTSIRVQLARFDTRPTTTSPAPSTWAARPARPVDRVQARVGAVLVSWFERRGIRYSTLRQDLPLSGRTFETVLALKAGAFGVGFLAVLVASVAFQVGGEFTSPALERILVAAAAGALVSFVPDLLVRREAAARRRVFRRALGSWLDLVALEMAGSAAPAEALPTAARVGSGWAMLALRDTLYRATVSGTDHWEALTDLGQRIGVPELIDMAALTRLVGRDGAQVRDTLTARATTMRRALLADAEGRAHRRDQSMLVAQILIGLGFVMFLMYPAIVNVLGP